MVMRCGIKPGVGVLALGTFLPPEVRPNSWWPKEVVDAWRTAPHKNIVRPERETTDPWTAGVRRVTESFREFKDDPFKGAKERRVMPEGMTSLDMEYEASVTALTRWGGRRDEIDALFVYSQLPDYISVSNAPGLHQRLGLPADTLTFGTEAACNSFITQLELAVHLIHAGRIRHALLVQSSGIVHACRPTDHHSVWFGDGASAVVVGPVAPTHGVLAISHRTNGEFYSALVSGCPGARWWSGEPVVLYNHDIVAARKMLLSVGDTAKEVTDEALARAELRPTDVNFYATHQSTHWFRAATQEYLGLTNAQSVDTFEWTGSLAATNAPLMLDLGERAATLKAGDIVAVHAGGIGITYSAAILRWGTG